MRKPIELVLLFVVALFGLVAVYQGIRGASQGEDYTVLLEARTFIPRPGVVRSLTEPDPPGLYIKEPGDVGRVYLLTQFWAIPTREDREELESLGVQLLAYVPNFAWYASVPVDRLDQLTDFHLHRATVEIRSDYRMSPELAQGNIGAWARNPDGTVNLTVVLFKDLTLEEGRKLISEYGGRVNEEHEWLNGLSITICESQIDELADSAIIQWIEQVPPPPTTNSDSVRAEIGADLVQGSSPSLEGSGVVIGVWDGGWVDWTHPDLAGRVTVGDPDCVKLGYDQLCSIQDHPTHVAGIIIGDGTLSAEAGGEAYQWRGVAPGAHVVTFGWWLNPGEAHARYADAIHRYGIDLSSNSWGTWYDGRYALGSNIYDYIVGGGLGRPISIVGSAGNQGRGGRYVTIGAPNSAKNTIVVGAVCSVTGEPCAFTSRGPTRDGRIKPDVVAPGCRTGSPLLHPGSRPGIVSTVPDLYLNWSVTRDCSGTGDDFCYPYDTMQGTSMAAPAVAGAVATMIEQYRLTKGVDPLPSTLKAVLINTAQYVGGQGPNYVTGYGLINVHAAVEMIRLLPSNIIEGQMNGTKKAEEHSVVVPPGSSALKVTLVWDDFRGTPGASLTLINDLDLTLKAPDGTIHFPWILDHREHHLEATRGVDRINNVEQVLITNPAAGTWSVRVSASKLPEPPQTYSLAIEPHATRDTE